jgi:general secretion pathway protein D
MPEAEVVLDVEVIEVSDKNAENVGLLLSNYNVQVGAFSPSNNLLATSLAGATTVATTGTTTTAAATVNNLVQAFTMKGFGGYVTVPNATYNLGKTLAKGEVLSNPKIRVKNKEKAKFNVGTRVPITTTTLNGTVSQVNVQYVDVGVKVNAEPTIQLNNEVSIKLNLEVSSILTKEKVGADGLTTVVTIGTRNIDTVLSLKDNETSIIGGLIQKSDNNDKTKLYLLSDIPLIGPMFTNTNTSKDKTELMLAITPRLVRGIPVPLPGLASFGSGKEDHPTLIKPMSSFDLEPVFEGEVESKAVESKSTPAAAPAKKQVLPAPAPVNPVATVATPAQSATAQPVIKQSLPKPVQSPANITPVVPVAAPPAAKAPPAPRSRLEMSAPQSAAVGEQFSLDVNINDVKDLVNAPFVLTFDPIFVDFVSATEGSFMKKDGKPTSFSSKTDSNTGMITISLGRTAGSGGVSSGGALVTATFRAKNQGPATFAFKNVAFTSSGGSAVNVLPFSTAVDIR